MKLSAILGPLLDAKADHELIRKMVLAHEESQADALERRRANDRKRQAEKYARDHGSRESREPYDAVASHAPATRVEDNLQTQKVAGKETRKITRSQDERAFRDDLGADLPPDLLDGIVKVRREKRGQCTALAARLFRDDAAKCGMSVHEAAEHCVSRSWITVKPEYFQGRGPPRGRAPPPQQQPRNAGESAQLELIKRGETRDAPETDRPESRDRNASSASLGDLGFFALKAVG